VSVVYAPVYSWGSDRRRSWAIDGGRDGDEATVGLGDERAAGVGVVWGAFERGGSGSFAGAERGPDLRFRKLGDVDASEYAEERTGLWTRGFLIRRTIADGEMAFFSTWCPVGTRLKVLVAVEGHRLAIEDGFEAAKNELGLDHNEIRSWHGWHRHVSLVMLAFAMLAAIRHRANAAPLKKTSPMSLRRQRR